MKTNPVVPTWVIWIPRLIPAVILLQTLFFKFTAAPESVFIFETLGVEPWGRIGSGVAELIAAVLLLTNSKVLYGAILSVGVMSGAILSHLTKLGIEVQGDGGLLFALAILVWLTSLSLVFLFRKAILRVA